jgi:octaprenyl-diphosphate synthase
LCSGLGSQHASRRIGATTNQVCEGELLQNERSRDVWLNEDEYLEMIRRKTGALTAVCCELGAHYAGADEPTVRAMHDYGLLAGMAFQVTDDILDAVGDAQEVGKTLGQDLALGKLTLPTIHCLATAEPPTATALAAAVRGTASCAPATLSEWLEETQSIEYAVSVARNFVSDAVQRIDAIPPNDARSSLIALAEFILDRRF